MDTRILLIRQMSHDHDHESGCDGRGKNQLQKRRQLVIFMNESLVRSEGGLNPLARRDTHAILIILIFL